MKTHFLAIVLIVVGLSACSKKNHEAVVANIQQTESTHQLNSAVKTAEWSENITPSSKEVKTSVTFNKSQIFNKDFLYGADLQHSSIFDQDSKLFDQVLTMGHEIAFFRKVGDHLQLVADQSWKFESDVNKPERLINEFLILEENDKTITVKIDKPSPVLRQMFWGSQTDITRSAWLRSVQFDPNGNYLLMESSIETVKGEIVEHMESLFPRENLITEKSQALWTDENQELSDRFEFLSWFPAFRNTDDGRTQDAAAFKFNLAKGKSVKWYVTDNVPDDVLLDVKNSVEGWNRYFQKMWGTDGLIFAGKLPKGIKLGDPRYNVIVWDNVQDGDAAYESQAVDPLTGIQSHSNIYIPYSWLKTATEYWTDAQYAQKHDSAEDKVAAQQKFFASKTFMGSPLRFGCYRDLSKIVLYGSQKSEDDLKALAREVLKGVIMHEVGHALGMDHNFKGSLINENGQFTASIMDYNHYNLEKSVFDSVDSAKGPILEYDRQFLDALYNEGKTLKDSPVLPSCNDDEADSTAGGVDPLCSRYDAGANPYNWMLDTIQLIEKPQYQLGLFKSVSESLKDIQIALQAKDEVSDKEDYEEIRDDFFKRESALFDFYTFAGAHSLRYSTTMSLKSLKNLIPDILQQTTFNESSIRQQTITSLEYIFTNQSVPAAPLAVLTENVSAFVAWTQNTAYYNSLNAENQATLVKEITTKHDEVIKHIKTVTFTKVRQRVAANLANDTTNSYYFSADDSLDVEAYVITLLQKVAMTTVQGEFVRSFDERKAAITSFVSFRAAGIATQEQADEILNTLKGELKAAKNSGQRDQVRALISLL